MAQEPRSRLFDSHDFRRVAPVNVARPADAALILLTDKERLMVADGLTELGYSARQISLILGGPDKASVEQATGKRIAVRSLPPTDPPRTTLDDLSDANERNYTRGYVEGAFSRRAIAEFPVAGKPDPDYQPIYNQGYEDGAKASAPRYRNTWTEQASRESAEGGNGETQRPVQEQSGGSGPGERTDQNEQPPYPARSATNLLGIDQSDIVDAYWHSMHGDPSRLANLASGCISLTGALQAYVMAAAAAAGALLDDFDAWEAEFMRQMPALVSRQAKNTRAQLHAVSRVVAAVPVEVSTIPVLGQGLAQMLRAGAAIREALRIGYPLPLSENAAEQADKVEGADSFLGLVWDSSGGDTRTSDEQFAKLKESVANDDVAPLLPQPRRGTRYSFAPTLAAFQAAAHALGLYTGEPSTLFSEDSGGES